MTTATTPAISSAQIGNGRTPHYIRTDGFHALTLCGRRADRVLTDQEAAKAARHCAPCTRALEEITGPAPEPAPAAPVEAPAAAEATLTPGDVIRPGVTIRRDGSMTWRVVRDGVTAVIFDEKGMRRGRWAAWSPYAGTPKGIVTFTDDAEAAVDAVLATLPMRTAALATETGASREEIRQEAARLELEWVEAGVSALRVSRRRGMELTGPAVIAVREALAVRAAQAAPAVGEPEWRTLKGMEAPFFLYGTERDGRWYPAGDRKRVTGQPLLVTRVWMERGLRRAEDAGGRELYLYGPAARFWTAPVA